MKKEDLIVSAGKIPVPNREQTDEYEAKRDTLAAAVTQVLSGRPDLDHLIGAENGAMMADNHRNHARFISSLLKHFSPEVLVETVLWVFRAYRSHGFQLTYWPAMLDIYVDVMRRELTPQTFQAVYPLYHWMIIHLPAFTVLTDPLIHPFDDEAIAHPPPHD